MNSDNIPSWLTITGVVIAVYLTVAGHPLWWLAWVSVVLLMGLDFYRGNYQ